MIAPGPLLHPAEPIPDRHELKYAVPEALAPALREAIRPFCRPDPHAAAGADGRYVIVSLYLDTWDRALYRLARERRTRRVKLRVRAYGDGPYEDAVYLEVKRKERGLVRKSRARVPAPGWADRLRGACPAGACEAERRFRDELFGRGLEPALLVRYEREAWVGAVDRYARVTFDRRIACVPWGRWSLDAGPGGWLAVDDPGALVEQERALVLELKCEREVPRWMAGLVARFGLRRVGLSKYCNGVDRVWGRRALAGDLAREARGNDHG